MRRAGGQWESGKPALADRATSHRAGESAPCSARRIRYSAAQASISITTDRLAPSPPSRWLSLRRGHPPRGRQPLFRSACGLRPRSGLTSSRFPELNGSGGMLLPPDPSGGDGAQPAHDLGSAQRQPSQEGTGGSCRTPPPRDRKQKCRSLPDHAAVGRPSHHAGRYRHRPKLAPHRGGNGSLRMAPDAIRALGRRPSSPVRWSR